MTNFHNTQAKFDQYPIDELDFLEREFKTHRVYAYPTKRRNAVVTPCMKVKDPDMFFSKNESVQADCVALCEQCPMKSKCLDTALSAGINYGVWGGVVLQ